MFIFVFLVAKDNSKIHKLMTGAVRTDPYYRKASFFKIQFGLKCRKCIDKSKLLIYVGCNNLMNNFNLMFKVLYHGDAEINVEK